MTLEEPAHEEPAHEEPAHEEPTDRRAVVPWHEPSLRRVGGPPARLAAAARTLARARPTRVALLLTARPLLGASAIALVAAAGKAVQVLTGAARPTTTKPSPEPALGAPSPSAGPRADLLVSWTSVEVRWVVGPPGWARDR